MTPETWLGTHPYLEPVARFCAAVDEALADLPVFSPAVLDWDEHAPDFEAGLPVLHSPVLAVDLSSGGALALALVERLSAGPGAGALAADARSLAAGLAREPDAPRRVAAWLLGDDGLAPAAPGLLRFLGWRALARSLAPLVAAFAAWRNDERWLRGYCPVCGNRPAMAQLIGIDPGRKRFLWCGCCGARWRYVRTACPFCEANDQRLGVVAVEGERNLRIDFCEECRGYLKTYNGAGDEAMWLADWTTLHLDVIAQERGLKRHSGSLFELEPELHP